MAAVLARPPAPLVPHFFTLTFPAQRAPTESEAQRAWRSLVGRLRYRRQLGFAGWVLHRQANASQTLHFHGIAALPYFGDRLALWRELIQASGFGVQNRLVRARPEHAAYVTRYISAHLATLSPLRRAYSFSRSFPQSPRAAEAERIAEVGAAIGMRPECEWIPEFLVP